MNDILVQDVVDIPPLQRLGGSGYAKQIMNSLIHIKAQLALASLSLVIVLVALMATVTISQAKSLQLTPFRLELQQSTTNVTSTGWTNYLPQGCSMDVNIDEADNKWFGLAGGANCSAGEGGIFIVRADGSTLISNTSNSGLAYNSVGPIARDAVGNRWFGTCGGGVSVLRLNGTWQTYNKANSGLAADCLYDIAIDAAGNKWFSTPGGGVSVLRPDETWDSYLNSNSGLATNYIYDIAVDSAGNKWFGTGGGGWGCDGAGVNELTAGGIWQTYNTSNSGLPDNTVRGVAVANDGSIWFGTACGGIGVLHTDGSWQTYNTSNSGLANNFVASITFDSRGNKWFGSGWGTCCLTGAGASVLRADGSWQVYNTTNSGLADNHVWAVAVDEAGTWIPTRGGGISFLQYQVPVTTTPTATSTLTATSTPPFTATSSPTPTPTATPIMTGTVIATATPTATTTPSATPFITATATPTNTASTWLFAVSRQGSNSTNQVYRFPISGPATVPTNDLTIFDPSLQNIYGVTFSPSGEIFISSYGGSQISRFLNPAAPVFNGTITSGELSGPLAEIFVGNRLYVSQVFGNDILRFDLANDGGISYTSAITDSICCGMARGLAYRSATQDLFLTMCCGASQIIRFRLDAAGNRVNTSVTSGNGLNNPHDITISPWGELFVANSADNNVLRFVFDADGNPVPNGQLSGNGLSNPVGITFSPWGELFVGNLSAPNSIARWLFDAQHIGTPNGSFTTPNTVAELAFYSAQSPASTPTATPTASSTPSNTPTPTATPTSTSSNTPTATATSTPVLTATVVWINPPVSQAVLGVPVTVAVAISNISNLGSFQFTLAYSPSLVSVTDITLSDFPGSTGRTFVPTGPTISNTIGVATFGAFSLGAAPPGAVGSGVLAQVHVQPLKPGVTPLRLQAAQLSSISGAPIPAALLGGALLIPCPGDFNSDGVIDITDIQQVAYRWGSVQGDLLYDEAYDIQPPGSPNGVIDILDVQSVAYRWNTACSDVTSTNRPVRRSSAPPPAASLTMLPLSMTVWAGNTFTQNIRIDNAEDLGSYQITLTYNPASVQVLHAAVGPFPGSTGRTVLPTSPYTPSAGTYIFGAFSLGASPIGPSGTGTLASVVLRALDNGASPLTLVTTTIGNRSGNPQPIIALSSGYVNVFAPPPPVTATVMPTASTIISSVAGPATTVVFPPGFVSQPITVAFALTDTTAISPGLGLVGLGFTLDARDGSNQPVTQFSQPFTITIHYTDTDVVGLSAASLQLYYWSAPAAQWIALTTHIDIPAHTLTATVDHMTRFSTQGKVLQYQYLPLIER